MWSNLNSLHRNPPYTYTMCTLHPVLHKVWKVGEKVIERRLQPGRFQTPLPSAPLTDSLACMPSPRPLWMQSIDPEDGEEMKGGERVLRKSKHCSRWQNTDHPGDLDLPCSLFLYHFLWPLASQPKATFSPAVFHRLRLHSVVFVCGDSRIQEFERRK